MKKYLRLPTHTKEGWLVFLAGFLLIGLINFIFNIDFGMLQLILGLLQIILVIAFVGELIAIMLGKNKPLSE